MGGQSLTVIVILHNNYVNHIYTDVVGAFTDVRM
jgi:hypothetical protein